MQLTELKEKVLVREYCSWGIELIITHEYIRDNLGRVPIDALRDYQFHSGKVPIGLSKKFIELVFNNTEGEMIPQDIVLITPDKKRHIITKEIGFYNDLWSYEIYSRPLEQIHKYHEDRKNGLNPLPLEYYKYAVKLIFESCDEGKWDYSLAIEWKYYLLVEQYDPKALEEIIAEKNNQLAFETEEDMNQVYFEKSY